MTLPSVRSSGNREQIGVFDYTDDDERVEEISKKLLRKFDSPVTETPRAIDKYDFLRIFAQDTQSKELDHRVIDVDVAQDTGSESKELGNRVIDLEVQLSTKEKRSRCEHSGYGTSDLIDVISDGSHGRIGISSSTSSSLSEDDEASTGEQATNSASVPHEVDSDNSKVLINPDVIVYGDIYCTNSKLTFSCNCMNVESSSVNATKGTFSCQWKIEDIIRIESQWCLEVETAFVNVLLKSRDPKRVDSAEEISGIDLLKFSVCDPKWSKEVETVKLLDLRYKDIWLDTITEGEESACSGHNLGTSLTNLADSFEDLVYPQGDSDAVVVRKQDIELLKPRRFVNDTIIDFYIKYLKSRIPPEERGRFHFFNCFFFRKLANLDKGSPSTFGGKEAYQRVQKWTKNVDLFEKDYIFIPINCSFHWSLIIICHPGESVPSHVENPPRLPCILHLDSIKGSHKGGLINIFPSYLREEWNARHGNTSDFSRAPDLQCISLEVLLPKKDEFFLELRKKLPQQENSFDCGLFLLHYLDLFVAQAPANFNPTLITRSTNFLTRNWFPAKEASLKRGYILELLYNLHKGHDPSVLPAKSKSKLPHCGASNKNDQENKSKNVIEICNWRKPFDGSSSIVTNIPQTKFCSPDLTLSKEIFYTGGYDPKSSKRQNVFMSPIVEEVQESGEKEETHVPMDIEESIGQEIETIPKAEGMLYIEDSDDDDDQENKSKNVVEICNWRKPFDSSSSTVTNIPQTKSYSPDLILSKETFYAGGYDAKPSKRRNAFVSPIVEEVQESGEKEETHMPMEIEESIGQEIETLPKKECMLYIEDSEDDDETVSVEYVSDSEDAYEVERKEEDDDDELFLITGESREIKSASTSIRKGVRKSKSRDLAAASCDNDILLVLSDDEISSTASDDLDDKSNFLITSSNVMAKRPKT